MMSTSASRDSAARNARLRNGQLSEVYLSETKFGLFAVNRLGTRDMDGCPFPEMQFARRPCFFREYIPRIHWQLVMYDRYWRTVYIYKGAMAIETNKQLQCSDK